jgi:hypothetical protein
MNIRPTRSILSNFVAANAEQLGMRHLAEAGENDEIGSGRYRTRALCSGRLESPVSAGGIVFHTGGQWSFSTLSTDTATFSMSS